MSDDLVTWLREQVEKDAGWSAGIPPEERLVRAVGEGAVTINDARWVGHAAELLAADRAVKLAILDEHATEVSPGGWGVPTLLEYWCQTCDVPRDQPGRNWCRTVRLLGSGYSSRPGYLEDWKP